MENSDTRTHNRLAKKKALKPNMNGKDKSMKDTQPMANNLETPGLALRPYQGHTCLKPQIKEIHMNNEVTPAQSNEVTSLVDRMAQP